MTGEMAGERDVLAEALHDIHSWNAATERAEADAILTALAARGWGLVPSAEYTPGGLRYPTLHELHGGTSDLPMLAPSPEPLPLDVERLARALGNWCRYRSESCDEPSPCSHDWSLAQTLFRDMAEPREPAP